MVNSAAKPRSLDARWITETGSSNSFQDDLLLVLTWMLSAHTGNQNSGYECAASRYRRTIFGLQMPQVIMV
jgi:hypothetical protein